MATLAATPSPARTLVVTSSEAIDFDALQSDWCSDFDGQGGEDMYRKYKGKYFVWTGEVKRVTFSQLSEKYYVWVRHCPDHARTITVFMRDDQNDVVSRLMNGDIVTYRALLSGWGAFGLTATDGEIISPTAATTPSPTAAATGAAVFAISIFGLECVPNSVIVDVPTTVIWTNKDPVPRRVRAYDWSFGSEMLSPGQSYSFTFTEPGSFHYSCGGPGAVVIVQ